jgi:16S rRNA (guanine527-N7)-methyltransferase
VQQRFPVTDQSRQADKAKALALIPVSRETEARLQILVDELIKWQTVKNLVSSATLDQVWTRHVADSLQLLDHAAPRLRWLDMGSGGGFPGLVIGIMLIEQGGGHIDLVESNARKCAFLRHVARLTAAPVTVHQARLEDISAQFAGKIDVVTARALAPLDKLVTWSDSLLKTGAVGLFLKGQDIDAELTEASKSWRMEASKLPSVTDPGAHLLMVRSAESRRDR